MLTISLPLFTRTHQGAVRTALETSLGLLRSVAAGIQVRTLSSMNMGEFWVEL